MTLLLLFLCFAVLFLPLVEWLWQYPWHGVLLQDPSPIWRVRVLAARMIGGVLMSLLISGLILMQVRMAPPSSPYLPAYFVHCLDHAFVDGPGFLTIAFMFLSLLCLSLVTVALFYPLPSFPQGERRQELEEILEEQGVSATVEVVPYDLPGCWSETTPHPRVVLLGDIESQLSSEEITAVLLHEAGHLAAGDHRSRTWARAFRRLFFFFGGAGALYDAFVHEQERRADDQVLKWHPELGGPLNGALRLLADYELEAEASNAAIVGAVSPLAWLVKQRLARLAGEEEEEIPRFPKLSVSSLLFLLLLLSLLGLSISDPGACTLHCLIQALP